MRYLSLFSGVGGGDLGLQHLAGMECVGYVEWNKYCQRVIAARIQDGFLSRAPIYGDIRVFNSEGFAASYTGLVDLVAGGFPCQPFSSAGQQLGELDPRNMWPATIRTIRIIRPRFAFLENVATLTSNAYFGTILRDLSEAGYDAEWGIVPACAVGAPHTRERVFILAYAHGERSNRRGECERGGTVDSWHQAPKWSKHNTSHEGFISTQVWAPAASDFLRMADGLSHKMDRIAACGNGQVPLVAATAWRLLSEGLTSANPLLSPENH